MTVFNKTPKDKYIFLVEPQNYLHICNKKLFQGIFREYLYNYYLLYQSFCQKHLLLQYVLSHYRILYYWKKVHLMRF